MTRETNKVPIVEKVENSLAWLPAGWITEIKIRKGGKSAGDPYKCYIAPSTGCKFYSKQEVFRYLETGKLDCEISQPKRRKINTPSVDNVVSRIESSPDGLPPGWTKEIKFRKLPGHGFRKDPYYTDPVNGFVFRSKSSAIRYLKTGKPGKSVAESKKMCKDVTSSTDIKLTGPVSAQKQKLSGTSASRCLFENQIMNSSQATAKQIHKLTLDGQCCEAGDSSSLVCSQIPSKTRQGKKFHAKIESLCKDRELLESKDNNLGHSKTRQGKRVQLKKESSVGVQSNPLESNGSNTNGVIMELEDKLQLDNDLLETDKQLAQSAVQSGQDEEEKIHMETENKLSCDGVLPELGDDKQEDNKMLLELQAGKPSEGGIMMESEDMKQLLNGVLMESEGMKPLENELPLETNAKTGLEVSHLDKKLKTGRVWLHSNKAKAEKASLPRRASKRLAGQEDNEMLLELQAGKPSEGGIMMESEDMKHLENGLLMESEGMKPLENELSLETDAKKGLDVSHLDKKLKIGRVRLHSNKAKAEKATLPRRASKRLAGQEDNEILLELQAGKPSEGGIMMESEDMKQLENGLLMESEGIKPLENELPLETNVKMGLEVSHLDKKVKTGRVRLRSNKAKAEKASLPRRASKRLAGKEDNEMLLELQAGKLSEGGIMIESEDMKQLENGLWMESEGMTPLENELPLETNAKTGLDVSHLDKKVKTGRVQLRSNKAKAEKATLPRRASKRQAGQEDNEMLLELQAGKLSKGGIMMESEDMKQLENGLLMESEGMKPLENELPLETNAKTGLEVSHLDKKVKTGRVQLRSNKAKAEKATLPRRASKRLVGLEAELSPGFTNPERIRQVAAKHLAAVSAMESGGCADKVLEQNNRVKFNLQEDYVPSTTSEQPEKPLAPLASNRSNELPEEPLAASNRMNKLPEESLTPSTFNGNNWLPEESAAHFSFNYTNELLEEALVPSTSDGTNELREKRPVPSTSDRNNRLHENPLAPSTSNRTNEQQEKPLAPLTNNGTNKQPEKPLIENPLVDEKQESPFILPFGDSWPDPCLEFAFKTLTSCDDQVFEENRQVDFNPQEDSVPSTSEPTQDQTEKPLFKNPLVDEKPESSFILPFGDSWPDPSLEFAFKTLTAADHLLEQNSQVNFSLQDNSTHSTYTGNQEQPEKPSSHSTCNGANEQPGKPLMKNPLTDEKPESQPLLPFGDSWSDPCLEFAFKTLTSDIPVTMDALEMDDFFQEPLGMGQVQKPGSESFLQSDHLFEPGKDTTGRIEQGMPKEQGKHC